jgi:hypothetical protein
VTSIQVESWEKAFPDIKALFPGHWKELAMFQEDIPLGIDEEKYAALDKAEILLILTARSEGKLVGYYFWFVMPHPHYCTAGPMGLTDMYYVLPEYRGGTGARLFIASETELRKRGVIKAITSCKLSEDHTAFLECLGWTWSDKTFVKLLKGENGCP